MYIYILTYCLCLARAVQRSVLSCCPEEPEAPQLVADAKNAAHGLVDGHVGRDKREHHRWPVHGSFLGSALRRSWSRSVLVRRHPKISIYRSIYLYIYLSFHCQVETNQEGLGVGIKKNKFASKRRLIFITKKNNSNHK